MAKVVKVIAAILLAPIAVVVVGIGGCEARKAYYDWQVRQMCEKDGGIVVYEHIKISSEQAAQMRRVGGHLSIADEAIAPREDIAALRRKAMWLHEGALSIERVEHAIVRRSDGKVVARVVSYGRSGGDFPLTLSHPSHYSCPEGARYYEEIAKVFLVDGVAK